MASKQQQQAQGDRDDGLGPLSAELDALTETLPPARAAPPPIQTEVQQQSGSAGAASSGPQDAPTVAAANAVDPLATPAGHPQHFGPKPEQKTGDKIWTQDPWLGKQTSASAQSYVPGQPATQQSQQLVHHFC